ncbi:MAG: hypothetical protein QM368_01505 [Bacillota bacterium]|jgi:hypothetical protein|nr:hypothetical protein [Bacillota bacterium]HHU30466.1 hypothetical protein [Bacillota bacterium]
MLKVCLGEFRSKDTAIQCIQKLGEHNFIDVYFFRTGKEPFEGMNPLKNAYAGELPHFARGTPGSDIAIEGRSNTRLYDKETAIKIMGDDTKPDNAYTLAVNITNIKNPGKVIEILRMHGADIKIKETNFE